MYGEDIDLSNRIVLASYQNYYIPERILHYKGESTKKGDRKYLHAFYDAMLIFYQKYYPHSGRFISTLIRVSIALRKGYAALFERGKWGKDVAGRYAEQEKKIKHRHSFICCQESHYEKTKTAVTQNFPSTSIDFHRLTSITTSPYLGKLGKTSDIIFCYPDISFDQMLQLMDEHPPSKVTYHIYHPNNDLFISPNL